MRYFETSCALKPVVVGGRSFIFEPVGNRGGSWFGVLAVEDDSAADILASGQSPIVGEMTKEQYDAKKKALAPTPSALPELTRLPPSQNDPGVIADRAGSTNPTFKTNGGPNSTECLTAVTILSTDRQPPREPILDGAKSKGRW